MHRVTDIEELSHYPKRELGGSVLDCDRSNSNVCAIPGPILGAEWWRKWSWAISADIRVSGAGEMSTDTAEGLGTF